MTMLLAALPLFGLCQGQEEQPAEKVEEDLLKIEWCVPGHQLMGLSDMLLAATADGKWLVSAGENDSTIKVWSIKSLKLERTILVQPKQPLHFVDVSKDSTMIIAGGFRYTSVYDLKTGKKLRQYIHRSSFGMAFVLDDQCIYNVDLHQTFFANNGSVNSDLVKPDGRFCNFTVKMLSADRRRAATFAGPINGPRKGYLLQWFDLTSGFSLFRHQLLPEELLNVPYEMQDTVEYPDLVAGPCTPSDEVIAIPHKGWKVYVAPKSGDVMYLKYDGRKDKEGNRAVGPGYKMSPQGNTFLVASDDFDAFALFSLPQVAPVSQVIGATRGSWALCNERIFRMGGMKGMGSSELVEFNLDGTIAHNFNLNASPISSLAVRKSDGMVAAALSEGALRFYSPEGDLLKSIVTPEVFQPDILTHSLNGPAILSDLFASDQYIAGGCGGPFMFVFDQRGNLLKKHYLDKDSGWADRPHLIPVNEGANTLVSTRLGTKGVRLIETLSGELKRQYKPAGAVSFMAATESYVYAVMGQEVLIWEIGTGKLMYQYPLPAANIRSMAANQQLKRIVFGTSNGHILVMNLKDGSLVKNLEASEGPIIALTCTRDNRLISRTSDETDLFPLKFWDLGSCTFLKQYRNEVGPCSPDQNYGNEVLFVDRKGQLVFGRYDGTIVVATAE